MDIPLQDQLYIVSVSLAVITIVLLIFCIVLCVNVGRLKADNKERKQKEREKRQNQYAYNNPTIQPDEELYHRGFLMHKGQIVPRLASSGNGAFSSNDPSARKPSKPSSVYSQSSRDLIPINDLKSSSKDASRDFKTIMNPNSTVFADGDVNYTERQPVSNTRNPTGPVNNGNSNNAYVPPRPSQFNSNIMLGPSSGQNQNAENRPEGVTYFNNRAIDY